VREELLSPVAVDNEDAVALALCHLAHAPRLRSVAP